MPKGILLRVDGSFESVNLPEKSENMEEMLTLIGSEDLFLGILACDSDSARTIFLFLDVYNDFHDETFGKKPPLNQFIAQNSKAQIFGDVIVYLSEPEESSGEERIYDLTLTIEDLKHLMKVVEIREGVFRSNVLFEVLDDQKQRKELDEILAKVDIKNYTDE